MRTARPRRRPKSVDWPAAPASPKSTRKSPRTTGGASSCPLHTHTYIHIIYTCTHTHTHTQSRMNAAACGGQVQPVEWETVVRIDPVGDEAMGGRLGGLHKVVKVGPCRVERQVAQQQTHHRERHPCAARRSAAGRQARACLAAARTECLDPADCLPRRHQRQLQGVLTQPQHQRSVVLVTVIEQKGCTATPAVSRRLAHWTTQRLAYSPATGAGGSRATSARTRASERRQALPQTGPPRHAKALPP
jgi:hypothetical protein